MPSRGRAFVPENVKGFTTCKAGAHASLLPLSSESQGGGNTTAVSTVCHQVDIMLERDLLEPFADAERNPDCHLEGRR